MSTIVKFALREVIINDSINLSDFTRIQALDELIRIEREEVQKMQTPSMTAEKMRSFREYRKNNDRIATIKYVRQHLDVGLAEALIIVKGIDAHDGIA